jgi:hypothetical protein
MQPLVDIKIVDFDSSCPIYNDRIGYPMNSTFQGVLREFRCGSDGSKICSEVEG